MKRILLLEFVLLGIFILNLFTNPLFVSTVYAAITVEQKPDPVCQDSKEYTLTFNSDASDFVLNQNYTLGIWKPGTKPDDYYKASTIDSKKPVNAQTYASDNIAIKGEQATFGQWHYKLWLGKNYINLKKESDRIIASGDYFMYPKDACVLGLPILEMPSPVRMDTLVNIKVRNINPKSEYLLWFIDGQEFINGHFPSNTIIDEKFTDKSGAEQTIKTASFSAKLKNEPGDKTLCLKHGGTNWLGYGKVNCEISIPIEVTALSPQGTPTIIRSGGLDGSLKEAWVFSDTSQLSAYDVPPPPCAEGCFIDGKCTCVNTAIGNISTEPQGFVQSVFSLVLGIAGGIALILIILAGYKMMASQGNPEQINAARDQLISAIVGLLFIIFSFVILQVIGVDILRIPGFGE